MRSIVQVFSFDLTSKILLGVIGIIIIRYMPETEYALYSFALAMITVVAQTLAATFRRIYIVGFSEFDLKQHSDSFLGLQLLIILFLTIVSIPFHIYFNGVYLLILIMIVGTTLVEYIKTAYQQELQFLKFSVVEIVRSASFFALTLLLIFLFRHSISAWQVLSIQASTMFFIFILVFRSKLNLKQIFAIKKALEIGKSIFKGSYKYLLGLTFFTTICAQLDVFMLKWISTELQLATYGSAFRYYTLVFLALNSVNAVLLPIIQNTNNRSELDDIYMKHRKMLMLFVPIVLIGAWLSGWIIPYIDMGKYPDAVATFRILAVSAIFSFAFSPHVNLVMKFGGFKYLYYVIVIAVVMNLALNSILIPLYGAIGAAIATLVTFLFNNYLTYVRAHKLRADFHD
ncbi:polysaccharide biosynthesis C-terminal domain-containing protein [Anaerobacillus sp. CMMVII]|uniref:polysaccharide biosynthesis C-terminal domain-containing protein n=1 Tax=Anaerobacillus sp. CMMVII TaxID=2755588 RepID=UPI0021B78D0F|nr:polysaccharide biosynthesis C-terminal domain-containing protein [Anaerobacillus sp. CMMVII]MCT8140284.1 polysaccharide biosynthesis C-terminal domain-containing protein [Anaerobacillus sp. CMMVII]